MTRCSGDPHNCEACTTLNARVCPLEDDGEELSTVEPGVTPSAPPTSSLNLRSVLERIKRHDDEGGDPLA